MISRAPHRGLNSTIEHDHSLQHHLVEQFEKFDRREMMKSFLGPVPEEGTTGREAVEVTRQEGREAPVLWVEPSILDETAVALQSWEGEVLVVKEDGFVARLKNLVSEDFDEEIEMPLGEIAEDDKTLIEPGAFFYWSVGRETTAAGQVKRTSVVKFRRLPLWSMRELVDAKKKAADVRGLIGWGRNDERTQAG